MPPEVRDVRLRFRWHGALLLVAILTAGYVVPASAQSSNEGEHEPISWQSAGDSYSSGEGVFGNIGDCAQSDQAYGPRAATTLAEEWTFGSVTFTACTGHVMEDFFVARGDKGSLWDWALNKQNGPERVDIISLSFGGNDIGFARLLKDCLDIPIVGDWNDFLQIGDLRTGCDTSEEDIRQRIDALLDPPEECSGSRAEGTAGYLCDLNLGHRRGSLIDAYYDIVTDRLTTGGRLYVVGYPRLVAPLDEWPGWIKIDCEEILRGDSERLGRLADYLDVKLREAVDRANEALGETRVVFVDRLGHYRENKAELCGTNEDWINGLAIDRGEGLNFRPETSFHVNAAGHAATAGKLVEQVRATFAPQPIKRCGGVSAVGVEYQLPTQGAWRVAESGDGGPGVVHLADPNGISSVGFRIRRGSLINETLNEAGVGHTEVVVPGATRAVRYLPPASETGDGLAEVVLIEAGGTTIEATAYVYIEDLERFSPDDLRTFLDSLCVNPAALPEPQTLPDETATTAGRDIVITDPDTHPRTGPEVVFHTPDNNASCVLWEDSFICDIDEFNWDLPDNYLQDCDNGVVPPEEYLDSFNVRVSGSADGADFTCASSFVGLTYGIATPTPVEVGDSVTFAVTRCKILADGVQCRHVTGRGVLLTREAVQFS